jgi:hypothetical protein
MVNMSEEKEVGWCDIRRVRLVYGEADPIFFAKSLAFSAGVRLCVVSMNNESPPINRRAEPKKCCENINTGLLCIKWVAFWKRVE